MWVMIPGINRVMMMSEEQATLARAYKRAAIGLAIAAVVWTAAILITGRSEDEKATWVIPVVAAALSVICFSLHEKSKHS
jgi:predicted MFS family arabinose efflux permease